MSQRIKELALQAELHAEWFIDNPELEKFAELIIKECAELTLDYKSEPYYNGWLDYRHAIKRHFGVE